MIESAIKFAVPVICSQLVFRTAQMDQTDTVRRMNHEVEKQTWTVPKSRNTYPNNKLGSHDTQLTSQSREDGAAPKPAGLTDDEKHQVMSLQEPEESSQVLAKTDDSTESSSSEKCPEEAEGDIPGSEISSQIGLPVSGAPAHTAVQTAEDASQGGTVDVIKEETELEPTACVQNIEGFQASRDESATTDNVQPQSTEQSSGKVCAEQSPAEKERSLPWADSVSVLHELRDTLKESASAICSLQKSTEQGLTAMTQEVRKTNELLQTLLQEVRQQSRFEGSELLGRSLLAWVQKSAGLEAEPSTTTTFSGTTKTQLSPEPVKKTGHGSCFPLATNFQSTTVNYVNPTANPKDLEMQEVPDKDRTDKRASDMLDKISSVVDHLSGKSSVGPTDDVCNWAEKTGLLDPVIRHCPNTSMEHTSATVPRDTKGAELMSTDTSSERDDENVDYSSLQEQSCPSQFNDPGNSMSHEMFSEQGPSQKAKPRQSEQMEAESVPPGHINKTVTGQTQRSTSSVGSSVQNAASNITSHETRYSFPGSGHQPDVRLKEPRPAPTTQDGWQETSSRHRNRGTSERGRRSRVSALGLSIESSNETESQRLSDALKRARAPERNPAPKARSFDTVLCLDTSASMLEGGAFEEMIDAANEFIDGIDDRSSDLEENIALVTFGGDSNIVQHLTIDFTRIRDAIERIEVKGKSPFFEAMVVSLAAFDGKGGTVSVSGEYDVHPRIIFITDGHITESSSDPFGPDRVRDPTNTRAQFSRLMMDLSPKKDPSMPHPLIFVPVGAHADRNFLRSVSTLSDGMLIEPKNIKSLCSYFVVQETIGKVIVCLNNKDETDSDGQIEAVVNAIAPHIDGEEMAEVIQTVKDELQRPNRKKGRRVDPTEFNEVYEDKEGVMSGERLSLGTRVLRGPDWRWGEQDGGGAGTVIGHEDKRHPFTWVLWDAGGWNRYPYGSEMGYHVWATKEHPVLAREDGQLRIGMIVQKGPKWSHSEPVKDPGVVIRKSRDSKLIKVRWQSGEITVCPSEAVQYSGPDKSRRMEKSASSSPGKESPRNTFDHAEEEEGEGKIWVWQYKDDWLNWRLYTKEQIFSLEKDYKRKKNGSGVIQRDGNSCRVFFGRKREKNSETGQEREVQRVLLTEDGYMSLLLAEKLLSESGAS